MTDEPKTDERLVPDLSPGDLAQELGLAAQLMGQIHAHAERVGHDPGNARSMARRIIGRMLESVADADDLVDPQKTPWEIFLEMVPELVQVASKFGSEVPLGQMVGAPDPTAMGYPVTEDGATRWVAYGNPEWTFEGYQEARRRVAGQPG